MPKVAAVQTTIAITSASDLAKIGNDAAYPLDGHYQQTKDIVFTASDYSTSKGWNPIGSQTAPFTGVYDGQNHQILEIVSNGNFGSSGETGVFGVVKGATIQNLGIVDGTFSNSTYLASFSGKAYDAKFINCYANNTIDGKNTAAGLVAHGENTCFHQCFNMGDISGSNDIGGIVGVLKSGSIDTCFNAGSITSTGYLSTTDNVGGIVGDMGDYKSPTDDTIRNCYNTGSASSRSLYSAGIAGGADIILHPEIPYDVDNVVRAIKSRTEAGKHFTIIAVAEGAITKEDAALPKKKLKEKQEKKGYPSVAYELAEKIQNRMDQEVRITVPGHTQRGGSPCPYDRVLATRLGAAAADLILKEDYGYMVGIKNGNIRKVPLGEVAGKLKMVDPKADIIKEAKIVGISFGDE